MEEILHLEKYGSYVIDFCRHVRSLKEGFMSSGYHARGVYVKHGIKQPCHSRDAFMHTSLAV